MEWGKTSGSWPKFGMVYSTRIGNLKLCGTIVACEKNKEDKALVVLQQKKKEKEKKIIQWQKKNQTFNEIFLYIKEGENIYEPTF